MKKGKQKLTLTVDADAVERARRQDINISDLTERILQTITVDDSSLSSAEERKEYLQLLATMDSVIKSLHVKIRVGKAYWSSDEYDGEDTELYYAGGGRFEPKDPNALHMDLSDDLGGDWSWPLDEIEGPDTEVVFDPPMRIIGNFIEEVGEKKRRREVEMHDLRVARSVLEAVLGAERAVLPTDQPPPGDAAPPVKPAPTAGRRKKK